MTAEYEHTDAFRGARFTDADLANVSLSGDIYTFVVNGVDVTEFVAAELDRRHLERQVRELRTADDYRAMSDTIERLWSDTVARAERLPEPARHERVDGE